MTMRLRAILFTVALGLVAVAAAPYLKVEASGIDELLIDGRPLKVRQTSLKCDLESLPGVSTKRLSNCNSAKLVEFEYNNTKKRVVRFHIDPFDDKISEGVRAELRDMHEAVNGEETWYRFATLIPQEFPLDARHRLVLAQWHEHIRNDGQHLRPPISHRLWDGRFVVTLWNNRRIERLGPDGDGEILFEIPRIEQSVFYDFVYKVKWSGSDDGEIVAWMRNCPLLNVNCEDGTPWQEVIHYQGSTGYGSDVIAGYYFKLGLYTVSEFDVPFTAYHKNYRRGGTAQAVGATGANFK